MNEPVSDWLAEKVGPEGLVVASDIDTRFLDRLSLPNLEVRKIDVTSDPLGEGYTTFRNGSTCSEDLRKRLSGRAAAS